MVKIIIALALITFSCCPKLTLPCNRVIVESKLFSPYENKTTYVCSCIDKPNTLIYMECFDKRRNISDTSVIIKVGNRFEFGIDTSKLN